MIILLGDCILLSDIKKIHEHVLITGGNGFIGSQTAFHFSKYITVSGIGHGSQGNTLSPSPFTQWIESDISCSSLLELHTIPTLIIHCAGGASVAASLHNPQEDLRKNLETTLETLEYIRQYAKNCRFIYLSSAAVYGNVKHLPIEESNPCLPISPYGLHKVFAEEVCCFYHAQHKIPITIIRPFSVYGPGLKKQLLWDACRKLSSHESQFFGDGTELRDWLHIDDLTQLVWNISQQEMSRLEIINACSGKGEQVSSILNRIKQYFPSAPPITFTHVSKGGDPMGLVGSNKKAYHTGWRPRVSLDEGIKKYVLWYKKEHGISE